MSTEIESVANEDWSHGISRPTLSCTTVDISHLPCGMIGGVMSPQFSAIGSIISTEIESVANEEGHVISRDTAS